MPHAYSGQLAMTALESCGEKDSEVSDWTYKYSALTSQLHLSGLTDRGRALRHQNMKAQGICSLSRTLLSWIRSSMVPAGQTSPSLCRCNKGESALRWFMGPIGTQRHRKNPNYFFGLGRKSRSCEIKIAYTLYNFNMKSKETNVYQVFFWFVWEVGG